MKRRIMFVVCAILAVPLAFGSFVNAQSSERESQIQVDQLAAWRKEAVMVEAELVELNSKYGKAHPRVLDLKHQLAVVKDQISKSVHHLAKEGTNTRIAADKELQDLKAQLSDIEVQIVQLKDRYGPDHPKVKVLKQQSEFWTIEIRKRQQNLETPSLRSPYVRIANLANQLNSEIVKLQPLRENEKPLASAMSELQNALAILETESWLIEKAPREMDLTKRDDVVHQQLLLEAVGKYQQLINERNSQLDAMQAQIVKAQQQAEQAKAQEAMLAIAAQRAHDAQAVRQIEKLKAQRPVQVTDDAKSNDVDGLGAKMSRLEDELKQIKIMLREMNAKNKRQPDTKDSK